MLKNRGLIIFAVSLVSVLYVQAQPVETNSPYSQLGYGQLGNNSFGMSRAMGGIGYGLRTNQQINPMNPASYTAMDSLTFLFDIGVNIHGSRFKEGSMKETHWNGNLEYISMQFPLGKWMAASAGVIPFSVVGYEYAMKDALTESTSTYIGEGGLNQAYIGLSAQLAKWLSIGVNASYLFGNITHTINTIPTGSTSSDVGTFERKMSVTDFRIQAGLQYTQQLNEKSSMTFGLVYAPQKKLLGKYYRVNYSQATSSGSAQQVMSGDTTRLKSNYALPATYGGGLTYVWDKRLTVGADVTYQSWSDVRFGGETGVLNNRLKVGVGGEYLPSTSDRSYWKRVKYRLGAYYDKSYIKVGTGDLKEVGVTCGFGFPIRSDKSIINVGLEYVNRTPSVKGMITENYFRLSVGLTFNEMWFYQFKFK